MPRRLDLGFPFYGSGNIGDDLMLSGFLQALPGAFVPPLPVIRAVSAFDIRSQRHRFPGLAWCSDGEAGGWTGAPGAAWLGVGDTPFQLSAGPWFLEHLERCLPNITGYAQRCLIGVGVEREALGERDAFARVASAFQRIVTRDAASADLLTGAFGVPPERVAVAGDLAHIHFHPQLAAPPSFSRRFALGVNIALERSDAAERAALRRFVRDSGDATAFVANEVRDLPGSERRLWRAIGGRLWHGREPRVPLLVPDYGGGSMAALLEPLAACESIITSRYHGALAASWLGCRVAVFARSSKLLPLAEDLGVTVETPPLTAEKLHRLREAARAVPREVLASLAAKAAHGVRGALVEGATDAWR